jgi:hypothetical protein
MIRRGGSPCRPKPVKAKPVKWREGDKLKMPEQRIGPRRDATRALTQAPTRWGSFGCPTTHTVGQKAVNPRGTGTASPSENRSLPNSKTTLTKGGESRSPIRRSTIDTHWLPSPTRSHRILLDVVSDLLELPLVPYQVVIALFLPKGVSRQSQHRVGPLGCDAFQRFRQFG